MQIFKAFYKNVKGNITSLIIYFVIFMILAILLSNNGSKEMQTSFEDKKINVAVIDKDHSELSQALYDYLNQKQNLVSIKDDQETVSDELFFKNIGYVLYINPGFEENLKNGNTVNIVENVKEPGSMNGKFIDNQVNQYLTTLNTYLSTGFSTKEAIASTKDTMQISSPASMYQVPDATEVRGSLYYFYTYIPYVLTCMLTLVLGGILILFREKELSSRIKCSFLSNTRRNLYLIISSISFSIFCWGAFVIASLLLYQDKMFHIKGALYILNSFVFLLIAISITYLISFLVNTHSTLSMASNVIGLGLSFLGGIFVPLNYMSHTVVSIGKFLPTYWYVKTSETIDAYSGLNSQTQTIMLNMGIEIIFALTIFAAAIVISKYKTR